MLKVPKYGPKYGGIYIISMFGLSLVRLGVLQYNQGVLQVEVSADMN